MLGYVALSWAVRFDLGRDADRSTQIASLLYPLDTFSMYAEIPGGEMSYLLIRDAQKTVHQVTEYRSFDCDEPIARSARCSDRRPILYLYRDLVRHIESHAGPGTSEVELIFRTWSVRPGKPTVQTSDCVVAHCRVSR